MSRPRLSREQPRPARPRLRWGSPRAALGPCRAGMRARKRYRSAATDSPGTGQRETAAGSRSHAVPPPGCRLLYPAHLLLPWRTFRVSGKLRRLRGTAEPRPPGALPPRRPARPAATMCPSAGTAATAGRDGRTAHTDRRTDRAARSAPRPRSPALGGAPGRAARGPAAAPRAPRRRLPAGARGAPLVSMSERRACGLGPPLRPHLHRPELRRRPASPPGPARAPHGVRGSSSIVLSSLCRELLLAPRADAPVCCRRTG